MEQSVRNLLDPIWNDAAKLKIPVYLQFEVTSRCNMMCRMCYIASNCDENRRKELPAAAWLEIARQARDMGLVLVNITGGEPIIKDDFWQLYEGISNLGVIHTLNTNGTLMTKETVKRLAQAPPFRVIVSMYGGSEETYARVSNNGKWFDLARAGVENLLEAGINTIIRMTIVRDNIHDLPKVYEWADSIGQRLFCSYYMSPRREGGDTDPIGARLDPSQMIQVKETMRDLYRKKEMMRDKDNSISESESGGAQPEHEADEPTETPIEREPYRFMTEDGFGCGAGQTNGFISYDGKLLPCSTANEPSADLKATSFPEAWREIARLSRKIPSCAECDKCDVAKYCVPCPPKLMSESGSYCEKSAYLCEYARGLKMYYEKMLRME